MRAPVVVIGVGNVLLGDDGVGPCVVRLLEERLGTIEGVELTDCGTSGFDVSGTVIDREVVIFVDAVDASGEPGSVVRLEEQALTTGGATGPRISPHEPGIRDSLAVANLVGRGPREALLIGVVPGDTSMGTALTPRIADAILPAANAVIAELKRLGHAVEPIEGHLDGFFSETDA